MPSSMDANAAACKAADGHHRRASRGSRPGVIERAGASGAYLALLPRPPAEAVPGPLLAEDFLVLGPVLARRGVDVAGRLREWPQMAP